MNISVRKIGLAVVKPCLIFLNRVSEQYGYNTKIVRCTGLLAHLDIIINHPLNECSQADMII